MVVDLLVSILIDCNMMPYVILTLNFLTFVRISFSELIYLVVRVVITVVNSHLARL